MAARPLSPASIVVRLAVAWVLFSLAGTVYLIAALAVFPSRVARLTVANVFARWIGRTGLWLTGQRLEGATWRDVAAHTPAILLLNHASTLDMFVAFALCPNRTSGIGKRELLWVPVIGQAWWLSGSLLLDRRDHARAVRSLARVAEQVKRYRLSVFLAPEGTRSDDGRLQPFKKGFAHLALATRLPIVPIVLHGAADHWPNGTWRITPGVLRVEVLDPIPTTDWSRETLDDHIAAVHARYAALLESA